MSKTDCFAYVNEGRCFALSEMDCEVCKFYKHSDNPKKTREQILNDVEKYQKMRGGRNDK